MTDPNLISKDRCPINPSGTMCSTGSRLVFVPQKMQFMETRSLVRSRAVKLSIELCEDGAVDTLDPIENLLETIVIRLDALEPGSVRRH